MVKIHSFLQRRENFHQQCFVTKLSQLELILNIKTR